MPERRPEARLMQQGRWLQDLRRKLAEGEARGSTPRRAEGPFSPPGRTSEGEAARPDQRERHLRTREGNTPAATGRAGSARNVATAPATARPMWSGTADAAGPKAEPEWRNPPRGGNRKAERTGGSLSERMGPKDRERRKDAGRLRRWNARVPAAATVGAGSNADPHLVWQLSWTGRADGFAQRQPLPSPHPLVSCPRTAPPGKSAVWMFT